MIKNKRKNHVSERENDDFNRSIRFFMQELRKKVVNIFAKQPKLKGRKSQIPFR